MRGLGWDNSPSLKVFIDECLACLLFLWIEGVYLGDLWNKRGFKVYGVVIGSMGRKNIVDFLIRSLRCLGKFGGQCDLIEMFAIEILLREVLTKRHIILRRISLGEERSKFHVRVTSKPAE